MQIIGIVAEYNPFHTGHCYQIGRSREQFDVKTGVVAVMSGNWVQKGDCAVADKWIRARLAVMGGADLVLELPTPWAASTAESFGRGAVELLHATGVVDNLCFGSECGQIAPLKAVAACLDGEEYPARLAQKLTSGQTFAVCRQAAVEELLGAEYGRLLATPNNNLGVEYIRGLNALHSAIVPMTVRREGAAHNSISPLSSSSGFVSATQLREQIRLGNWPWVENYLVPGGRDILEQSDLCPNGLEQVSGAILATMRKMTAEDWAKLPDSGIGEGLPRRLEQAGHQCTSLTHFFELAKTKRYTRARLSRLVLWAYLGLTAADVPENPPYLRVLGFNRRGREILKEMKKKAALPVLTKPAHARGLDEAGQRLFTLEARCTDLYDLCRETVPAPGREWRTDPVILE